MKQSLCKILFSLLLVATMLSGCKKSEFKVKVELPASVEQTYTLLYYASDSQKGWLTEGVLQVHGGKGEYTGATILPTLVYVFNGGNEPATIFYAEKGDNISVAGDSKDPASWKFKGNKITEQLSDWQTANRTVLASRDSKKINGAVKKYVASNSDNPVAAIILQSYFTRIGNSDEFSRLMSSLKGDAADSKWTNLVSRNDLMGNTVSKGGLPQKILLKSIPSGCDTISTGKVPALLYFSSSEAESYREDIMQLRDLCKAYGDSSKRVIANISFDTDSVRRSFMVRSDSLPKAIQAWMPLGISDPTAVAMGVSSVPCCIVIDSKRNVIYKGTDVKSAANAFKAISS
ncbi:MAG: hypothetical protein NC204_06905 [Candidatus Amulumruptor caecigallinarius]|nr:hypothetical protein [Candidatus Amulumruptor caecigallinarius]